MSRQARYTVTGHDPTPEGYHDDLEYQGDSFWEAWRAWRDARANGMVREIIRRGRWFTLRFHARPD